MDEMLYIITNCGDVVSIYEDENEMKAEYALLLEQEAQYKYTHYYYGTQTMTRAKFVCDKICGKYDETLWHNAKFSAPRLNMTEEEAFRYFKYNDHCKKCALCSRSPYKEEKK